MKIITDEKEIVKMALDDKKIHKKPSITITALAKHYHNMGMDKPQIKKEIQYFMSQNYRYFNLVKWQKIIDSYVNKYANDGHELLQVKNICITKAELEVISSLKNLKQEKILFVLLVYAKIFNQINPNNNNWTNSEDKDIFSDAKLTVKIKDQRLTLHKLFQTGLISMAKKVNSTNICVNFINENSDVVIVLDDFRNFVLEYLKYKGDNIEYCSKCGDRFMVTGKVHNYCKQCAKEIQFNQKKEWDRNSRIRNS